MTTSMYRLSINKLKQEGHGPQRHEGELSTAQIQSRIKDGIDPETGTTTDAETGKKHRCGKYSTRIKTERAYIKGYEAIKNSDA